MQRAPQQLLFYNNKLRFVYLTTNQAAGIAPADFEEALPMLVEHVDYDANTLMSPRIPETSEIEKLLLAAYNGRSVDF